MARKKIGIETPISDANRLKWSNDTAVALGGVEPERNAHGHREQHRRERELDGCRESLLDLVGDESVRVRACSEIAFGEALQVAHVLDVDRVVEAVLLPRFRDRLLRRPLAEDRLRRRPREGSDPEEDEDREPEEDRDEQEEPTDGEPKQLGVPPVGSSATCT